MFRRIRSIPETAHLSPGRINVPLWIYVFLEAWFQSEGVDFPSWRRCVFANSLTQSVTVANHI
jgi:hypothetical protein